MSNQTSTYTKENIHNDNPGFYTTRVSGLLISKPLIKIPNDICEMLLDNVEETGIVGLIINFAIDDKNKILNELPCVQVKQLAWLFDLIQTGEKKDIIERFNEHKIFFNEYILSLNMNKTRKLLHIHTNNTHLNEIYYNNPMYEIQNIKLISKFKNIFCAHTTYFIKAFNKKYRHTIISL